MDKIVVFIFCILISQVWSVHFPYNKPKAASKIVENPINYQAFVLRKGNTRCGGSILRKDIILTSATCSLRFPFNEPVPNKSNPNALSILDMKVYVGANVLRSATIHKVQDVKIHPNFSRKDRDYNVAILLLEKSIGSIGYLDWDTVSIAPLNYKVKEESTLITRGWGDDGSVKTPEVLKETTIKVKSVKFCTPNYLLGGKFNDKTMFCGVGTQRVNPGNGHEGSPVVVEKDDKSGDYQVGITSFVPSERIKPAFYIKITNKKIWDWINDARSVRWNYLSQWEGS